MIKFTIIAAILLAGMQFIQVEITSPATQKNEIVAPEEVTVVLQKSCYDCHSNDITMPWYGDVAPMAWFVRKHINDGRKVVNFSTFNDLPRDKQKDMYERIAKSVVIRMPLPSYTWIHGETKLTQKEKKMIQEWSKEEFKRL
ncbi:MAG: heme-binding domain-containing protein [Campylobacterota bacterium]|nr:heme-binding domain-containing protein [Campylobacterota bacterium]